MQSLFSKYSFSVVLMIRTLLECTDITLKEALEEVKRPLIESLSHSTRLQGACPKAGSCSPFSLFVPATVGGAQSGPKALLPTWFWLAVWAPLEHFPCFL